MELKLTGMRGAMRIISAYLALLALFSGPDLERHVTYKLIDGTVFVVIKHFSGSVVIKFWGPQAMYYAWAALS